MILTYYFMYLCFQSQYCRSNYKRP